MQTRSHQQMLLLPRYFRGASGSHACVTPHRGPHKAIEPAPMFNAGTVTQSKHSCGLRAFANGIQSLR
jgi:hypothetical protein